MGNLKTWEMREIFKSLVKMIHNFEYTETATRYVKKLLLIDLAMFTGKYQW